MDYEAIGIILIPEFITEAEEAYTIARIHKYPQIENCKTRNNIQRYGSTIPYRNNMAASKIPKFLDMLSDKLIENKLVEEKPDSITINQYYIGQAILPHIDSPGSGKVITVISLNSDSTMKFRKDEEEFSIELPRRSLIQIKGEIRELWEHSIDPVKEERYSIVFRCSLS